MKTSHSKFGPLNRRGTGRVRLAFYLGCADQSLRRSVARVTENAATMGVDMGQGIAVIDLVLHMYRRSPTRRKLAELWCVSRRLAMRRDFFFQPCAKEVSIAIPSGQAHRVSSLKPIRAIFDATRFVQTIPTPDRRHRSR
jgi:hypothetical protein